MFDHFEAPSARDAGRLATLLDVTLRDGGFEVDFQWPAHLSAALAGAVAPLGVDIVELGYLGGVPTAHGVSRPGQSATVTPDMVAAAARPGLRLAAMIHTSAVPEIPDLRPFRDAGLAMVRLVYHPDWREAIARTADAAPAAGLAVSVNLALASRYAGGELMTHAEQIHADLAPEVIYVADTCGAMLPEQVHTVVAGLAGVAPAVGFHAHDFLGLAYANALAAVSAGATFIDVSVLGLGRGGGNLPAEPVLIRHRLAGSNPTCGDLARFLEIRRELARVAGRPLPSLLPAVCGALNLTPVEEQALTTVAARQSADVDLVALWACGPDVVMPGRADDLTEAWKART